MFMKGRKMNRRKFFSLIPAMFCVPFGKSKIREVENDYGPVINGPIPHNREAMWRLEEYLKQPGVADIVTKAVVRSISGTVKTKTSFKLFRDANLLP